ncbi:tetratricopeptide (TPR) repeat protein [Bacillus mesophilus]|uniref:Collagenase n=1 Tax=Bacillus mesophilus TaxID=1808955 RepID=A0A6M0Q5B3_9BACI|nr:collagenase [Bacillus mesophilus]MBM7661017.1 tetratricopeptide (TPR) repeat protein [Bacillus mesophilus]NEY71444.1 hypothetical protein [Bacillus mesophilus]
MLKKVFFTILGLMGTTFLIVFSYLYLDNLKGTIFLVIALLVLFAFFIIAIIGLVRGRLRLIKLNNRTNISFVFLYLIATSLFLLIIWSLNFSLQLEFGSLSAREKIYYLQNGEISEETKLSFIQDYPVIEHEHIKFIYHPETEHQVQEIISSLDKITTLEQKVFGEKVKKSEPLEVIVLINSKDFLKLNPFFDEIVGGSYNSENKRVMIYKENESLENRESIMLGTFVHEYSHYLFDLYSSEIGLSGTGDDIPTWYEEGISEYMRWNVTKPLEFHGQINPDLAFTNLHTSEEWYAANEEVYYLAREAINYIVEHNQGNKKILSDILLDQTKTGSFEDSFLKLTGITVDSLNETIVSLVGKFSNIYRLENLELIIDQDKQNHTAVDLSIALSLIESYIGFNNFYDAIELLELLNNQYPNNEEVYWYLGLCNYYVSNFSSAIDWFNKIPDPTENVYKYLSELYLLQGDITQSQLLAKKSLEAAEENTNETIKKWKEGYDAFLTDKSNNPNSTFSLTTEFFDSARIELFKRELTNYDGNIDSQKILNIAFLEMQRHQFNEASTLVSMINKTSKSPEMLMLEDVLNGVSLKGKSNQTFIGEAFQSYNNGKKEEAYNLLNGKMSDESFKNKELVLFTLFYLHVQDNDVEGSELYYDTFMNKLTDDYNPDFWMALSNSFTKSFKEARQVK